MNETIKRVLEERRSSIEKGIEIDLLELNKLREKVDEYEIHILGKREELREIELFLNPSSVEEEKKQ